MMILRMHGPTTPVIKIEKRKYNEEENILEVIVSLKSGITLTDYSLTINYQNMTPEVYDSGSAIDRNDGCEVPLDLDGYTCGGGYINLRGGTTDGGETTTTKESVICTMKFKLRDDLLEEEIPNNLFIVEEAIVNNDEGTYEDVASGIVNIGPMASIVKRITLTNSEFDYTTDTNEDGTNDSYKCGETINLIGGTATIEYSNTKNSDTRTAILKLDETNGIYKWFEIKNGSETGNILNITKGPWQADLEGTKNINIDYKGMASNNVGVKVVDYIKNITIPDDTTTYYFNDEFNAKRTKAYIEWAGKGTQETTLYELIKDKNEEDIISGFNSTLDEIKKSSIEQEITVTLNYKGYVGTKKFNVTIKDIIDGITLTNPQKIKYKYGEEKLDLDNGTINIKWRSGEENKNLNGIQRLAGSDPVKENIVSQGLRAAIELNDSIKVTGFDSSTLGIKPINFEYHYTDQDGNTQIKTGLTYDIEIVDYIEDITLSDTKEEYLYGEEFESNVNIKWASKTDVETKTLKEIIEDEDFPIKAEISGFDSQAENIKKSLDGVQQNVTVTFTYGEEGEIDYFNETITPFDVTIKDQIKNITFEEGTIKKDYEYQEPELDLTGGKINVSWLSEATDERPLNNIEIKTGSSPITNNNVQESHLEDSILVTGFDSEITGQQPITIEYYYAGQTNPKEFTYNIKINTGIKSIDLNKNKITIPYGQDITDEYLKTNNYNVIITNSDDTTRDPIPVKAEWIGEYDKTKEKIGEEQVTYVDYNGTQIPLYITIENCLEKIELTKNIITVKWGETLNFTDEYKVIPVMANGDEQPEVLFTNDKVQIVGDYDLKEEGTYKVKVVYEGKEADFTIIVVDPIIEVRLDDDEKEKIQKEYKYDEELNLNGAQLTIIRESSKEVGPYKETIQKNWIDYDKEKLGIQKITINYKDDETQVVYTLKECFEVEVKDYIVDIILVRPDKTTYLPGEKLDLTGATVRTISASGKLGDEVAVTEDIISGYTEGILGAQRITVHYEGFEKTFDVIFTAQTGVTDINVYAMIATIIATASLTIVAMLTIIQREEERNKKM